MWRLRSLCSERLDAGCDGGLNPAVVRADDEAVGAAVDYGKVGLGNMSFAGGGVLAPAKTVE